MSWPPGLVSGWTGQGCCGLFWAVAMGMVILFFLAFRGSACEGGSQWQEWKVKVKPALLHKVYQHVGCTYSFSPWRLSGGSLETLEFMGKLGITCREMQVLVLALLPQWV